jgi:hypothetical protein
MLNILVPAIIGLVGVFVGAGITAYANFILAVRKEKADAKKEKGERAVELRTSARLVRNEFMKAFDEGRYLTKEWYKSPAPDPEVPRRYSELALEPLLAVWKDHKAVFAAGFDSKSWESVEQAANLVEHLLTSCKAFKPEELTKLASRCLETCEHMYTAMRILTAYLEIFDGVIISEQPKPRTEQPEEVREAIEAINRHVKSTFYEKFQRWTQWTRHDGT